MKTYAALSLVCLATACGGADPAPQTPATPPADAPPAKVANPAEACNELSLGLTELSQMVSSKEGISLSSAGVLRTSKRGADAFGALRVQMKKAVDLDPSLAAEVDPLDATIASELAQFDALTKLIETDARAMRDIVSDAEKIRLSFVTADVCAKKDVDCASKQKLNGAMDRMLWSSIFIAKTRAEITATTFKSAELVTQRDDLLKKLDAADRAIAENQKQLAALQTVGESKKEDLKKQTEALFKRCNIETLEKAQLATKKPQWVTSKEPELRKMVMVVRVLPEGRIRKRLDDWAAVSTGMRREAFLSATGGGFGSGFFVMPKEGELYIVTNRHVVDYGDRATLMMSDGTNIPADIVYTDPHADLAILKPDAKKEKDLKITYGLGLDPEPAKDQQVVIATGFPGLGAKPSYQTTRGYVSNQRFTDTFDGNGYIQHTAPIDRGNSGGPLTSEKNLVLGVNTLKVRERENVAMSVPSLQVANAVEHARQPADAETLRREAKEACIDVVAELNSFSSFFGSHALYQRISLSAVAESGSTSFNSVADRELGLLLLEEPIDALRVAVVERLVRDARVAHLNPFETCQQPEADDFEHILTMDRVRFKVRVGASIQDLVVRREFGRFQLLRFDMVPPVMPSEKVDKPEPKKPAAKKPQAAKK